MISVQIRDGRLSTAGHAKYAKHGKDIVCAGVSVLFQTLIISIESLTTDKIKYCIEPGASWIKYENLSEKSKVLVDSFYLGVTEIAKAHPEHVEVI